MLLVRLNCFEKFTTTLHSGWHIEDETWMPFADDIFKCIFLNDKVWILMKISWKFIPKGPINNIPALIQIMAWRHPGITWPQWGNPGFQNRMTFGSFYLFKGSFKGRWWVFYLITECHYHRPEQAKMFGIAKTHITQFKNCSTHDNFVLVVGSQSPPILEALGNFLYTCFQKRNIW